MCPSRALIQGRMSWAPRERAQGRTEKGDSQEKGKPSEPPWKRGHGRRRGVAWSSSVGPGAFGCGGQARGLAPFPSVYPGSRRFQDDRFGPSFPNDEVTCQPAHKSKTFHLTDGNPPWESQFEDSTFSPRRQSIPAPSLCVSVPTLRVRPCVPAQATRGRTAPRSCGSDPQ